MAVTDGDLDRFCEKVFNRSRQLVTTGVWSGIERSRLDTWLHAFADHDSNLLAAALLDHLSYRSKPQFLALLENLVLTLRLPGIARTHDAEFIETLSERKDPHVRFAPVIAPDQPPTKSGPYVLRLLQRQFRMRDQWLIWPERIATVPKDTESIFLLDDFTGTGDQFCTFWKAQGLDHVMKSRPKLHFVLLAAAIHQSGLDRIKQDIPGLTVMYSELLGPQHHFSTGTVLDYYKEPDVKATILGQLQTICKARNIGGKSYGPFGHGELGLCYAFEHATPNNTLPIYWYDSVDWSPLISR
jgi:hypothetical protein